MDGGPVAWWRPACHCCCCCCFFFVCRRTKIVTNCARSVGRHVPKKRKNWQTFTESKRWQTDSVQYFNGASGPVAYSPFYSLAIGFSVCVKCCYCCSIVVSQWAHTSTRVKCLKFKWETFVFFVVSVADFRHLHYETFLEEQWPKTVSSDIGRRWGNQRHRRGPIAPTQFRVSHGWSVCATILKSYFNKIYEYFCETVRFESVPDLVRVAIFAE